ncbi:wall-associated receptor kinase-like 20 [Cynara cardunculus var. scolymus]|uniref:wall-associated receptor kinase-like 20 n=1 Tax=Cynara cardunculus var. scolymus TaxID=59895 RepID=UPI000D625404|nr:wall-associated receptor kinase-like 20 [Cynara cardunculus var. scolymus]
MTINWPRLVIFVAVLLVHTGCAVATRCPDCGRTPVPYPLSTGPTCGNQLYKIQCDVDVLKFDTINNTYPVISISPENQRLVIGQSHFLPNTCVKADLATNGIQLNTSLPFTITADNTVFYFNCTDTMFSVALDCTPTSPCQTYQNGSAHMSTCRRAPRCCSYKKGSSTNQYFLRLMIERCRAYTSFVNLNISLPISRWPDPAVELMWVLPLEPPCVTQAQCDSTSTCRDAQDGGRRCFCNHKFRWDAIAGRCASDFKKVRSKRIMIVATTICCVGIIIMLAVFAMTICVRRQRVKAARQRLSREREEIVGASGGGRSSKIFTSKEIKKATNNFSSTGLLGVGGFGEVYKGVLDDGTTVAVKCAKLGNTKSVDQVLNEVRILCQVNHKNLVHLLGCCVELQQPFLVYEYIPNGSLFDHLHDRNKQPLTWSQRLTIAHDTAEGLAYLHFSASPPIYHRDVKASNILLDDKMKAKVADFGLSRLAHSDVTHVTTCAQGTLGYLDPDYYWNYQLTDKSDVYSFGVLLLEILTCQKAIDFNRPTNDVNLVTYVKRIVSEERLVDVIDPILKKRATLLDFDAMKAFGFLAMSCLEERRENRPSMEEVSEEIEYIMGIVATMVDDHSRDR